MRRPFACALLSFAAVSAAPAMAACSAANTFNYSFVTQAAATLNYANSYTYTASNGSGVNRTFTASFATNGLSSTVVGGQQMPAITNLLSGSAGGRTLMIGGTFAGRTANIAADTRVIRTTFTFAQPIRDLALTVHDVDFSGNQYRDWFMVTGTDGTTTYTPALSTPFGSNNTTGPRSAAGSALTLGPATTPFNLTATQAVGTGTSPNTNSNAGDILISFAQPVTSVTLRYGNYPLTAGERATGQQAYGISAVSFCPMPSISVTKSSAPFAATGPDRFNTPGADAVYTITATNGGGSPVDLNGLVLTDLLPTATSFYSGDFDPGVPGGGPFQLAAGASGVTLTAANVSYSNNGGASYGYTPIAGYDGNVSALRLAPGGSLAANSSFSVSFRARIN